MMKLAVLFLAFCFALAQARSLGNDEDVAEKFLSAYGITPTSTQAEIHAFIAEAGENMKVFIQQINDMLVNIDLDGVRKIVEKVEASADEAVETLESIKKHHVRGEMEKHFADIKAKISALIKLRGVDTGSPEWKVLTDNLVEQFDEPLNTFLATYENLDDEEFDEAIENSAQNFKDIMEWCLNAIKSGQDGAFQDYVDKWTRKIDSFVSSTQLRTISYDELKTKLNIGFEKMNLYN